MENLVRNIIRASFSQECSTYLPFLKKGKSSNRASVIPQHMEFLIEAIAGLAMDSTDIKQK
jgi:hypothetical protein